MKIENLRAVLHSFWIFNRSYILPGFFFLMSIHIWGSQNGVSLSFRLQTSTNQFRQTQSALWSYGRISKSKQLGIQLPDLTKPWLSACKHSKCLFFRCTSFFGRLVSALFKSIYGVDSRGLCFGGRLGALLTLITVKMDISLLLTGCKHRSTISGHGMNALQCLKGKRMWIQAQKSATKKNLRNAMSANKESVACWNAWNAWTTHRIPCLGHARSRGRLSSKPSRKLA